MVPVSVVIITKNESVNIAACIASARKISNNIILLDSGSTDNTVSLAKAERVTVRSVLWQGYGHSRNIGAQAALHNWIFSLDADERITDQLAASIKELALTDEHVIYGFKRLNFFRHKKIRFGSFAHDRVFRLYNRQHCQWNHAPVHERIYGKNLERSIIKTPLLHYAIRNEAAYREKVKGYAILCAHKYQQEKKRFVYLKSVFAPAFNFIKGYFFQLGCLDYPGGFTIASIMAGYTREKYQHLLVLMNNEKKSSFLQHPIRKILSFLS